jgi:hypothetical protein
MQSCTLVRGKAAWIASAKPPRRVDAGDENIVEAAILQVGQTAEPKLGAFALAEPKANAPLRNLLS